VGFVKSANAVPISARIDDHRFSDRVRDASIENRLLCDAAFLITVFLGDKRLGATNPDGRIKSERIAIADPACVFATDTVGAEAIAEGGSGK